MSGPVIPNPSRSRRLAGALILLLSICLWGGCADSTAPGDQPADGDFDDALVEGSVDPGSGSFVLQLLEDPEDPDLIPRLPVQLIGRNLQVEPATESVSLDVVVHNLGERPLHPPAMVWIFDLNPEDIEVLNPDMVRVFEGTSDPIDLKGLALQDQYGFDFSELFGEDGVLTRGEMSGVKTWRFKVPELRPFSFAARVNLGLVPESPRIAGTTFHDPNANGVHDPDEAFLIGGHVRMWGPDGASLVMQPDRQGRFSFPVRHLGLYELRYDPARSPHQVPVFTTPNPLQVVLTPGPDGVPLDFREAHFGVFFEGSLDTVPRVVLTDRPLDDLLGFPYELLELHLREGFLLAEVAFSGCQPAHPFTLYMYGGFMESWPVQANLVLTHEIQEDCEAYFRQELPFHLNPLRRAYLQAYGEPGILILNIRDYSGEIHRIRWQMAP